MSNVFPDGQKISKTILEKAFPSFWAVLCRIDFCVWKFRNGPSGGEISFFLPQVIEDFLKAEKFMLI